MWQLLEGEKPSRAVCVHVYAYIDMNPYKYVFCLQAMWYLGEAYEKGEGIAKVHTYMSMYVHCLNAYQRCLHMYTIYRGEKLPTYYMNMYMHVWMHSNDACICTQHIREQSCPHMHTCTRHDLAQLGPFSRRGNGTRVLSLCRAIYVRTYVCINVFVYMHKHISKKPPHTHAYAARMQAWICRWQVKAIALL